MADHDFESFFNDSIPLAKVLEKEIEEGNIEYKLKLVNLSDEQILHRVTQLHWRLNESNETDSDVTAVEKGVTDRKDRVVAIYFIGVEDNGYPVGISKTDLKESIQSLNKITSGAKGELVIKSIFKGRGVKSNSTSRKCPNEPYYVAEVIIRRKYKKDIVTNKSQINVALAGMLSYSYFTISVILLKLYN